ncbi:hypothetical protein EKH55_4299 [Sinorhizobium alkalisoli]|nr:hypothetical protein EKH55_4299 [Sinorhizobium alkalisoli]
MRAYVLPIKKKIFSTVDCRATKCYHYSCANGGTTQCAA